MSFGIVDIRIFNLSCMDYFFCFETRVAEHRVLPLEREGEFYDTTTACSG